MRTTRKFGLALAAILIFGNAAADEPHPAYDPLQTFAPLTLPQPVNVYRSGSGAPGPAYWQNEADYEIHARLDPGAKTLSATETISYTNNSPDPLDALWLQLDQNIYRKDSRSVPAGGRERTDFSDGYMFDSVEIEDGGATAKADYLISDTRMQIRLKQPLKWAGGQLKIHIRYHYAIPGEWGGRTGWKATKNGDIFDMAQWYPRMAVYDDIRGWDTLPYLGNEFYLEYGHFDYFVTVPSDMLVAGSGELRNPDEVLTASQRTRLAQARASDRTVPIRTAAEVTDPASRPAKPAELTWHFAMDHTRDVSFSASKAFIWDAARINLPAGGPALAMSFYPVESDGTEAWGRSTEYLKDAVEHFSERWTPYPYPVAVNVAGPVGGMEYPGILFDGMDDKGKGLFWLTAHEIGHTWFPMVVGTNERRDAWMDEGLNTFIDVYESDDFEKGVYGPKRDSEYAPGTDTPADQIAELLKDTEAPAIMTRADAIREKYRHSITYFKTAFGLVLLREQILGPERFDPAFRRFIRDWSYKHPSPSDFFRAMESAGGEDLSYFWRGWFMNNWTFDLAVTEIKDRQVTVANLGQLVLPATVEITLRDATKFRVQLPAETWIQKTSYTFTVDGTSPIADVVIDPDHALPDRDRGNNEMKPVVVASPATPGAPAPPK